MLRMQLVWNLSSKTHRYSEGGEGIHHNSPVSIICELVKHACPRIGLLSPLSDFLFYFYFQLSCTTSLDAQEPSSELIYRACDSLSVGCVGTWEGALVVLLYANALLAMLNKMVFSRF